MQVSQQPSNEISNNGGAACVAKHAPAAASSCGFTNRITSPWGHAGIYNWSLCIPDSRVLLYCTSLHASSMHRSMKHDPSKASHIKCALARSREAQSLRGAIARRAVDLGIDCSSCDGGGLVLLRHAPSSLALRQPSP